MVRAVRLTAYGLLGAAFGAVGVVVLVPSVPWPGPLVGAAVCAALLVGGTLFEWRRAGGYDAVVAVSRAARTGDLPEDAEPRVWVPRLERYARDLRTARWRYPVLMVPLLIALEPDQHHPAGYVAFCVTLIAIELAGTVDALVRAPGVTRRVEALTGRLAARWSADLRAPA